MSRNEQIENANSASCFEIPSILGASDDSILSYKSFNAADDLKTEKPTPPSNANVRALIDKHNSFQEKSLKAKLNDFETKKKSFMAAGIKLNESYRDCVNMEGDSNGVENIENFVSIIYKAERFRRVEF